MIPANTRQGNDLNHFFLHGTLKISTHFPGELYVSAQLSRSVERYKADIEQTLLCQLTNPEFCRIVDSRSFPVIHSFLPKTTSCYLIQDAITDNVCTKTFNFTLQSLFIKIEMCSSLIFLSSS